MSVTRGNGLLTDTDPIYLNLDVRGHFLVYFYNLVRVMKLSESNFNSLRQATPRYRGIYMLKDGKYPYYEPRDGQPYALESSP